jgi:hypothetical protein
MAGINHIDESEYLPSLKFRNNMENKEQNTGMSLGDAAKNAYKKYSLKDDEFSLNEQIQRVGGFITGFKAGASWQSSQPTNSGWVSVEVLPEDRTLPVLLFNGDAPEFNQHVFKGMWFGESKKFIPDNNQSSFLGTITHYMELPSPPNP